MRVIKSIIMIIMLLCLCDFIILFVFKAFENKSLF